MSERKRPAEESAPPIPDGGLGEAMPEWLRRPPAWHTAQPAAPPRRALPPPDESEIDPASLLTVEDLPDWLQSLANPRRIPTLVAARPPATPERRVIPRVIEATPRPATPVPAAADPSSDVPADATEAEGEPAMGSVEAGKTLPEMPEHAQSNAAIVLGTLLGVAVIAIVVLLVLLVT